MLYCETFNGEVLEVEYSDRGRKYFYTWRKGNSVQLDKGQEKKSPTIQQWLSWRIELSCDEGQQMIIIEIWEGKNKQDRGNTICSANTGDVTKNSAAGREPKPHN